MIERLTNGSPHRWHVVILQHRLLHYRTHFFELLRSHCSTLGIRLDIVVGQASPRESAKKDEGHLVWAHKVRNLFLVLPSRDLVWQPLPSILRTADLVIMMQESRIISNYPLLLRRLLGGAQMLAYWGHGRNFQSDAPSGLRERWKRFILTKVDWWFAYTEISADLVRSAGYPANRITCLDNAIDSERFRDDLQAVTDDEIQRAKFELGIEQDSHIALFCGSIYPDKRLDLLVQAMDHANSVRADITLVVVGDGPSMPELQQAAASRSWIKVLGVRRGKEKALYYRLASFILNPGAVGLHIVDAFCAGLVMISTSTAKHGPEVAYIKDGVNGILVDDKPEAIGQAILQILNDPVRLSKMQAAALADADRYTLANMVENFSKGLLHSLDRGRR